ncbi:MAG TPA: hypothetical protein VGG31_06715 [Candidatus Dormibacteraeota bacterium]|jgi:hypothetical protein
MDKSPILPAEHDPECRRKGPGDLDTERCERCRNLSARRQQFRETYLGPDPDSEAAPRDRGGA